MLANDVDHVLCRGASAYSRNAERLRPSSARAHFVMGTAANDSLRWQNAILGDQLRTMDDMSAFATITLKMWIPQGVLRRVRAIDPVGLLHPSTPGSDALGCPPPNDLGHF